MRSVRWAAIVAAALLTSAVFASPATATVNGDDGSDTLPTGHCLVATQKAPFAELVSRSGRFKVNVNPYRVGIENDVRVPSGPGYAADSWNQFVPRHRPQSRSKLCMQLNGNLVFRDGGNRTVWSSKTSGTGRHNYARILGNGAMVVRTLAGHTVWSSHTTAVVMRAGDRLASGHTLRNYTDKHSHTHLEMRQGGDLVLLRGTHKTWHSGTHTRGSSLVITASGRAAVQAPNGKILWRSSAVGRDAVFLVGERGRVSISNWYNGDRCWGRPKGPASECGED